MFLLFFHHNINQNLLHYNLWFNKFIKYNK